MSYNSGQSSESLDNFYTFEKFIAHRSSWKPEVIFIEQSRACLLLSIKEAKCTKHVIWRDWKKRKVLAWRTLAKESARDRCRGNEWTGCCPGSNLVWCLLKIFEYSFRRCAVGIASECFLNVCTATSFSIYVQHVSHKCMYTEKRQTTSPVAGFTPPRRFALLPIQNTKRKSRCPCLCLCWVVDPLRSFCWCGTGQAFRFSGAVAWSRRVWSSISPFSLSFSFPLWACVCLCTSFAHVRETFRVVSEKCSHGAVFLSLLCYLEECTLHSGISTRCIRRVVACSLDVSSQGLLLQARDQQQLISSSPFLSSSSTFSSNTLATESPTRSSSSKVSL